MARPIHVAGTRPTRIVGSRAGGQMSRDTQRCGCLLSHLFGHGTVRAHYQMWTLFLFNLSGPSRTIVHGKDNPSQVCLLLHSFAVERFATRRLYYCTTSRRGDECFQTIHSVVVQQDSEQQQQQQYCINLYFCQTTPLQRVSRTIFAPTRSAATTFAAGRSQCHGCRCPVQSLQLRGC